MSRPLVLPSSLFIAEQGRVTTSNFCTRNMCAWSIEFDFEPSVLFYSLELFRRYMAMVPSMPANIRLIALACMGSALSHIRDDVCFNFCFCCRK